MKRRFYHCPMRKLYNLFLGKGLGSNINEAFTYKNRGIVWTKMITPFNFYALQRLKS